MSTPTSASSTPSPAGSEDSMLDASFTVTSIAPAKPNVLIQTRTLKEVARTTEYKIVSLVRIVMFTKGRYARG